MFTDDIMTADMSKRKNSEVYGTEKQMLKKSSEKVNNDPKNTAKATHYFLKPKK